MEVGAGYGGVAYHLKKILKSNLTYIIVDLPEMLLFSGGYLSVNHPDSKIYFYASETLTEFLEGKWQEYDFALIPNHVLEKLSPLPGIDLFINTQSFQEMSEGQVRNYLEFASRKVTGFLYSDNLDQFPGNLELAGSSVSALLAEQFTLYPSPSLYKKIPGFRSPWSYKTYVGRSKRFVHEKPGRGALLKFLSGDGKMAGYPCSLHFHGESTKLKIYRSFIGLASVVGRRIVSRFL